MLGITSLCRPERFSNVAMWLQPRHIRMGLSWSPNPPRHSGTSWLVATFRRVTGKSGMQPAPPMVCLGYKMEARNMTTLLFEKLESTILHHAIAHLVKVGLCVKVCCPVHPCELKDMEPSAASLGSKGEKEQNRRT